MDQVVLQGVNVGEIATKCKSKRELYNFLSQDCQAFLPRAESTNIYFLKQIIRAQKDYIRRDAVKVSAVPQIEGLTVQDFLDYARNKANIVRYLPDERDWVHLDRQWVCDVIYTLDSEGVQRMVDNALYQRRNRLEQNRDLVVEMRPEFAEALTRCLNFSTDRGKAVNLIKDSSRRKRTLDEIEEVKEEERELKVNKHGFLKEAKRLKDEKRQLEEQLMRVQRDKEQLMSALSSQNMLDNVSQF